MNGTTNSRLEKLITTHVEQMKEVQIDSFVKELIDKIENFTKDPFNVDLEYLDLESLSAHLFKIAFHQFWCCPDDDNFRNIIDTLFYQYAGCYIYLNDKKLTSSFVSEVGYANLLMSTLVFSTEEESKAMYDCLLDRLESNKHSPVSPLYTDTILQESFLLSNLYTSNKDEAWKGYISKPLNPIYKNMLKSIETSDNTFLNETIDEMSEYHVKKSNIRTYKNEFYYLQWYVFPIEILAPLHFRLKTGKDIDFIDNTVINKFATFLKINDFQLSQKVLDFREALYRKYPLESYPDNILKNIIDELF